MVKDFYAAVIPSSGSAVQYVKVRCRSGTRDEAPKLFKAQYDSGSLNTAPMQIRRGPEGVSVSGGKSTVHCAASITRRYPPSA